jgi:hypothetical protein
MKRGITQMELVNLSLILSDEGHDLKFVFAWVAPLLGRVIGNPSRSEVEDTIRREIQKQQDVLIITPDAPGSVFVREKAEREAIEQHRLAQEQAAQNEIERKEPIRNKGAVNTVIDISGCY